MRVVIFSFRTFWVSFRACFRTCRRVWGLVFLVLALGVAAGVLTACLVAEPQPSSVLGSILADTYRPFACWGASIAMLTAGVIVCYLSAIRPRRPLFWLYVGAVGYVLGRLAAFACMQGAVGVISLIVCELPFALLPLCTAVGYYCALRDMVFTTLRPRCNLPAVHRGLAYLCWGAVASFVYIVVLWGLVSAVVNLVV